MKFLFSLLIASLALPSLIESAKILAVFPYPGLSQYIFAEHYLKTLAARGHEVTVINTFEPTNQNQTNFRVIAATKIHQHYEEFFASGFNTDGHWALQNIVTNFLEQLTVSTIEDPGVQRLLNSGEKFDLVIVELEQLEVLYGLAQHFGAELIGMSSYGSDWHIDGWLGNLSPVSYIPTHTSTRTDRMTFIERLENYWQLTVESVHTQFVHMPRMKRLYEKYFPQARATLDEVLNSFALALLGQHYALSYPRPYVPNMIEVGGVHINPTVKALPKHIEKFINESTHGVIYFSLGTNVKSKDLSEDTLNILLTTFARLKQRVLWKFELAELPGKQSNVLIQKWFPQFDILAHPNVKLFITHGGLLSNIESIYHGKPMLGLPVCYDQFYNVERIKQSGCGLGLDLKTLELHEFSATLQTLLEVKNYTETARAMSQRFHDQPMTPLETAIWWTEYVLRHKGASHMRVAALDLNFIQKHSLDTTLVIFGGSLLILLTVVFLVYKSCCLFVNRRAGAAKSDKRKRQ